MELVAGAVLVLAGCWFTTRGKRAPHLAAMSEAVARALQPPTYRVRAARRPVVVVLAADRAVLPVADYPSKAGLSDLAKYYKPSVAFLCKHREWVPGIEGHSYMFTSATRRATMMGNLHEKHRALERVYHLVLNENASLFAEVDRLRGLLESATQQEELLKDTCVRERDMRKAAERDKAFALGAKSELEEELHTRQAELHHLQTLLQQAAEAHQGAPEAYHGYRTSGRVLV